MPEKIVTLEQIRSVLTTQGIHEMQLKHATTARLEKLRKFIGAQLGTLDDFQKNPVLLEDGLYFDPLTNSLKRKGPSLRPNFEIEEFDMSWDSDLWFQNAEKISRTLYKRASLLSTRKLDH